ncbi:hypothetical protein BC332_11465 [Capsicum chinense]|nr:hypothetical protein BC332_11465 [Capsicum chinense]
MITSSNQVQSGGLNACLSTALKGILNHERLISTLRSDPGMPFSHAQSIFYTVAFYIISMVKYIELNGINAITGVLIFAMRSYFKAFLSRPSIREEVCKKTHMKIRDRKEVWVKTPAEDTYMSRLRRCDRKFGCLLGFTRRNEKKVWRSTLESDVKELKAQVNILIKLPRSLPPSSNDDGGEDEEDGMEY